MEPARKRPAPEQPSTDELCHELGVPRDNFLVRYLDTISPEEDAELRELARLDREVGIPPEVAAMLGPDDE